MHALRATQIADCAFQFLRGTFPLAYAAQMRSVFECNTLRSFFHERKERPMGKKRKLAGAYEVVFKDSHPHLKRPLSFTRTRSGPGLKTRCWRKPHFLPRASSGCSHRPCYNYVATFLPLPRARGVVRTARGWCACAWSASARARSGSRRETVYLRCQSFFRAQGVILARALGAEVDFLSSTTTRARARGAIEGRANRGRRQQSFLPHARSGLTDCALCPDDFAFFHAATHAHVCVA